MQAEHLRLVQRANEVKSHSVVLEEAAEEIVDLRAALTAAEATRQQVEQERDLWKRSSETMEEQLDDRALAGELRANQAEASRDALIAQLEIVREVLGRVGKHPSSCPLGTGIGYYKPPPDAKCDCGLTAALKGNIGNR